ncbi:hypothetical protein DL89DRAFT_268086 [Linderina pennispora]|uniref:Uncharacterized protein n=1 Tax=Linderina pennispora TaxID=61395 RepID=A0A1Y1W6Q7_9FUNG|nr:uncharacterized protein DL89DRAFT_268086 [Linderina pennispora]ORX69055.1 hypothetical protein DL89DRAFT_268086 [Linderina pennispora]
MPAVSPISLCRPFAPMNSLTSRCAHLSSSSADTPVGFICRTLSSSIRFSTVCSLPIERMASACVRNCVYVRYTGCAWAQATFCLTCSFVSRVFAVPRTMLFASGDRLAAAMDAIRPCTLVAGTSARDSRCIYVKLAGVLREFGKRNVRGEEQETDRFMI